MSFTFQEFTAQQPLTPETKAVALREEKVNPAYAAITTISDLPMPSTLPRNYKAFCREGFTNDSVFKCCSYIMQNGGSIPPKLYTDKTMKKGTIDSHPLLDKLDQPNLEQTGVDYREGILGFLLLAGNSYQYSIRKGIKAPPDELWSLQPDLVKIVPSRLRGITGYTYDDFSKEQNPIDPANIGRLRFWSPSDPLYGFSPMEVAAIMVDMQTAAKKWNLALLQNFAKPSGAWTSEAVLSPNDYSKTLEKLREIFAGFANAGKTQLLDGNLKWQQTGMAPTDVDWLEGIRYNAGSIANIFNIAPQLIGDTSSTTYDNMDQAKAASYTEAIFPLLDKLYALWNNWLLPMYPDLKGAYLYYDKETVEVVQAIIQAKNSAKIEQATKQFLAGGVDMYTYQEMCGTKPDPNGKGIYRVGPILVSSDNLKDYAEQAMKTPAGSPMLVPEPVDENAPPDDPNNPNPVQGNEPALNNQPAPKKPVKPPDEQQELPPKKGVLLHLHDMKATSKAVNAFNLDSEAKKKAYVKAMQDARDEWVEHGQEQLASYFKAEHKAVSAILDGADTKKSALKAAIEGQSAKLKKTLSRLWQDVEEDIGSQVAQSFKDGKKANIPTPAMVTDTEVRYLLQMSGEKVKGIDETTLEDLQNALAEGVANGESIAEIAARIDQLYLDDIIPNRSTVIAQSEVNAASSRAALLGARSSGIDNLTKVWMTTSEHPRTAHADADGQEVPIDEPFEVDGVEMDQPGDPSAPADLVVNCRCMMIFRQADTGVDVGEGDLSDIGVDESKSIDKRRLRLIKRQAYREFIEASL